MQNFVSKLTMRTDRRITLIWILLLEVEIECGPNLIDSSNYPEMSVMNKVMKADQASNYQLLKNLCHEFILN
jgi:hypothetical protein